MEKFTTLTAIAAPLIRDNIDTDAIIPSREMKAVSKRGLAGGLFAGLRYTSIGSRDANHDFVLNDPRYAEARILLGGRNFGCGSSREHAVWALAEYGFRAIIATSFNPIFRGNCVRNGIVPVELDPVPFADIAVNPITIDLERGLVLDSSGHRTEFDMDPEARTMLLEGLDGIDLTNLKRDLIEAFLEIDRQRHPWVYL